MENGGNVKCHLLTTVHQCIAVCVWNPKYRPNLKIRNINTAKECKTWNITCELFQILLFIFSLKKKNFPNIVSNQNHPSYTFCVTFFKCMFACLKIWLQNLHMGKCNTNHNDTHKTSWWLDLLNSKHEIKHDNTYLVWNLTIECA